jgi:hypothetical protein
MTDPKSNGAKKRNVSATIPDELASWLADQAAREQRTQAVVVARALQTYRQACEAEGMDDPTRASALPITTGRSGQVPTP